MSIVFKYKNCKIYLNYMTGANEINIPPITPEGKKITAIGAHAFDSCNQLNKITLPNTIKKIENDAFISCKNLKEIILSDNIIEMQQWAFAHCGNLLSLTIPKNVSYISPYCFMNCKQLHTVIFNKKIQSINNSAFANCIRLANISLPQNLKIIDVRAFYGCISLKEISIPSSVEYIGESAFEGCSLLAKIIIPSNCKIAVDTFKDCPKAQICYMGTKEEWNNTLLNSYTLKNVINYNKSIAFRKDIENEILNLKNSKITLDKYEYIVNEYNDFEKVIALEIISEKSLHTENINDKLLLVSAENIIRCCSQSLNDVNVKHSLER